MTVWTLGILGAGWFTAGLIWWWVLALVGLRFENRGGQGRPVRTGLRSAVRNRETGLDREIARRRAKHAVLN